MIWYDAMWWKDLCAYSTPSLFSLLFHFLSCTWLHTLGHVPGGERCWSQHHLHASAQRLERYRHRLSVQYAIRNRMLLLVVRLSLCGKCENAQRHTWRTYRQKYRDLCSNLLHTSCSIYTQVVRNATTPYFITWFVGSASLLVHAPVFKMV